MRNRRPKFVRVKFLGVEGFSHPLHTLHTSAILWSPSRLRLHQALRALRSLLPQLESALPDLPEVHSEQFWAPGFAGSFQSSRAAAGRLLSAFSPLLTISSVEEAPDPEEIADLHEVPPRVWIDDSDPAAALAEVMG